MLLMALCCADGFNFLVFATNLKAADVCDIVRHQRKAVVVLDLDNTLVDAVAVAVTQKDWCVGGGGRGSGLGGGVGGWGGDLQAVRCSGEA